MIFQTTDLARLFIILIMHPFITILFIYLAIRILKRNFNRITSTLSGFYILTGSGFLLNLIFLPLSTTFIGYIIYLIASFLILFGFIFLVFFIINLVDLDMIITSKIQYSVTSLYALIVIILLNIPEGIIINKKTNWTPKFSWTFLLIIYIFFTITIFIPIIFYSIKLNRTFKDDNLKKKFKYFLMGSIGMCIALYGLILYNTWHESLFRSFWSIIVYFIVFPSGILIYYGIGHNI